MTGTLYSARNYLSLTEDQKKDLLHKNVSRRIAPFIDQNSNILKVIKESLVGVLFFLYEAIFDLKNAAWKDKGLRLTAAENGIFHRSNENDSEIQQKINLLFSIARDRGSQNGIADDVNSLDFVYEPELNFRTADTVWIMGETFPEEQKIFLGATKIVELNFKNELSYGVAKYNFARYGEHYSKYSKKIDKIVRDKIIPIDTHILYE